MILYTWLVSSSHKENPIFHQGLQLDVHQSRNKLGYTTSKYNKNILIILKFFLRILLSVNCSFTLQYKPDLKMTHKKIEIFKSEKTYFCSYKIALYCFSY